MIADLIPGVAQKNSNDRWWITTKISDDFLDRLFREFYNNINSIILMDKSRYYKLAELSEPQELDPEITDKLDAILNVATTAQKNVIL